MKLYALYDRKADAYSSFHAEKSDAVATRGFAQAVLQEGSVFGKYADDFELVRLIELVESRSDLDRVNGDEAFWAHDVVVTARQVVDMQPKSDAQLSLLKEA